MALIQLPMPKEGKTLQETVKNLYDAYYMLLKEIKNGFAYALDSENVTEINTNITTVKSDKGTTQIKGPLLLMYDKQTPPVLRRKIGYDPESTKFVDEWYNPAGELTAYIDTNGKLIVVDGEFKGTLDIGSGNFTVDASGNVSAKTNFHVGNDIYLGNQTDQLNTKTVYFNDQARIIGDWERILISAQVFELSAAWVGGDWNFSGNVSGLENSGYIKGNSKSGSFTTADGKTVTVSNGLITSIV